MGGSALCGQTRPTLWVFSEKCPCAHSDSVRVEICCGGRENDQTRCTGDSTAHTPGKYPAIIESPGYAEEEFNDFIFTDGLCFLFHHACKCTFYIISLYACDFYGSTGQLILYDWKGCEDHLECKFFTRGFPACLKQTDSVY